MSRVLKAKIENTTTSVTTHFKKLTTANNVFIVSVIMVALWNMAYHYIFILIYLVIYLVGHPSHLDDPR